MSVRDDQANNKQTDAVFSARVFYYGDWGCFPLCQTDRSEITGKFPSKMERHFPIKQGQPVGLALATVCFSAEFPNKGKEPVCQKWNDKFRSEYSDRNKWTTSRGDPEYSGQKKPKRTFPFEFQPKFPESLA